MTLNVMALQLSFYFRIMIWTDWGKKPKIESADLAGGFRKILVEYDINKPTGVVFDHDTMR